MMRGPTSLYFLGNRSIHTLPGSMTWSSTDTIQLRSYCFFWSAITALLLSNVEHSAGHGPGAGGSSDLEAGGDHVVVVAGITQVELPVLGPPRIELHVRLDHEGHPGMDLMGTMHDPLDGPAGLSLGHGDLASRRQAVVDPPGGLMAEELGQ